MGTHRIDRRPGGPGLLVGQWEFLELGERPVDADLVRNARDGRLEVWWRGVLVGWLEDLVRLEGGRAELDWNQVRATLERGLPPTPPPRGGLEVEVAEVEELGLERVGDRLRPRTGPPVRFARKRARFFDSEPDGDPR